MARQTSAMDGFVPRRSERKVGGIIGGEQLKKLPPKQQVKLEPEKKRTVKAQTTGMQRGISRNEIDASLSGLDDIDNEESKKTRKPIKQKSSRKKWIKRGIILLVLIFIGIGAYVGIKAIIASANVFQGSILEVFQNVPLKEDKNGRSNIIVVGTSEDDPGHEGATLTDSMMILSIDQTKKNAFMISIPRDLYVDFGQACNSGYSGKINEYFSCVRKGTGVDADRAALAKEGEFVGDIFGLDIQYGVNVNYTVMRELVKAVGGSITVTIESRNPNGILDSNFDWKCGVGDYKVSRAEQIRRCPPRGHFIDLPNGPATLNAEQALYLAQARGDRAPTYGFEQSNFDREKNQQKIIKALREKAVSAGVLTDFSKVSAIIDALGNNLRTTFETKEFRTLVSLAQEIKSEDIKSISLIDGDEPVMTTGNANGVSIVRPVAGLEDYSVLRRVIQQRMSSDPVIREAAGIAILNGSGVGGAAQVQADALEEDNFVIETIGNAPAGDYAGYVIYQVGEGNKGTAAALEKRFGIKIKEGAPPTAVGDNVKFVIILGKKPVDTSASQ